MSPDAIYLDPTPTSVIVATIAHLIDLLPAGERPTIAAYLTRSPLRRHDDIHAVAILNDCAYDLDLAALALMAESNARTDHDGIG